MQRKSHLYAVARPCNFIGEHAVASALEAESKNPTLFIGRLVNKQQVVIKHLERIIEK